MARRALLVVAALAVAAKLVVIDVADHAVRTRNPALLQATAPVSPHAAALSAEARLAAGNAETAETLARRAVDGAPLSAVGLRILGLSLQARGKLEDAAQAMALAGGLGWRDTPTQLWLIQAYLEQGDHEAALERADALARRGQHVAPMLAIFMAAALDRDARPLLIARLVERPNWRHAFFESALTLPPEKLRGLSDFFSVFAAAGGGGIEPQEAAPLSQALFEAGLHPEAAALWRRHGARAETEQSQALADGGFSRAELRSEYLSRTLADGRKVYAPRRLSPFEWIFPQPVGSETSLAAPPWDSEGRALRVSSAGNQRLEMARQAAALRPGRHILSAEVMAEPGTRLEGFSWQIDCVPSNAQPAVEQSQAEPLEGGRTRLTYDFTVPATGCGAQQIRLLLRSGIGRNLDLWFDNVAVKGTED